MPMAMGSLVWFTLLWLSPYILLQRFTPCTATEVSYHDHCSVPESVITAPEFTSLPFCPLQTGYHDGGDRILNPNSSSYSFGYNNFLLFQTQHVYRTDVESVFKVEGTLELSVQDINYLVQEMTYSGSCYQPRRSRDGGLSFSLKGFWSEHTGELCMVSYLTEGKLLHLTVVLQLSDVKNSSTITSLVRGTFKSLSSADDQSYFEPISLLMFPQSNYLYTKVPDNAEMECSGCTNVLESSSVSLPVGRPICSVLAYPTRTFQLEYASDCNSTKSCNLLGDDARFLPQVMSLNGIQCSPDGQSIRVLVEFTNNKYFHNDIKSEILFEKC